MIEKEAGKSGQIRKEYSARTEIDRGANGNKPQIAPHICA